jgi:formylglycine-generating enzyme required for sulfatase activity
LLQGAARGLQLAHSIDLPLLGSGPGRAVPMLTLLALEEGAGLRIRTEVVEVPVWRLPLPGNEQLELVAIPAGRYTIGSPAGEKGRDGYRRFRQRCEELDVEARREVRLAGFTMARHSISQAQWRAVVEATTGEELEANPGNAQPRGLWQQYGLPDAMAVDSVSWYDSQEWLRRLNLWLERQWPSLGGQGLAPRLALPSESQWEVACRAGTETPFHFGDTLDRSWVNFDGTPYGLGRQVRAPRAKQAESNGAYGLVNGWGLAEMHGQLSEWCADRWRRDPREALADDGSPWEAADPGLVGNSEQAFRLVRGGSVYNEAIACRSAFRNGSHPASSDSDFGLRPICISPLEPSGTPQSPLG